jgi:hypothetical protein
MAGLEGLRKIVIGKIGVIYSLSVNSKFYIGYEYEYNVEKEVMDLLVRSRSYDELGYLYEASYEVLKNDKIELDIVSRHEVKSKKELAEIGLKYMLKMGVNCVNIWNPVDILNGEKPRVISKMKNVIGYIKCIDARKKEVEKVLLDEYMENGLSRTEGLEKVSETYKLIMCEIRKDKEVMFADKIIIV